MMRMSWSSRSLPRPRPVSESSTVTFCGDLWPYRVPAAHEWIAAVHTDPKDLSRIFPGLLAEERVDDMMDIVNSTVWDEEQFADIERRWRNVARVILTRHTGREWWRALNLINKCLEMWTGVNGSLLLSGCDAQTMTIDSWLDAAYVHLMRTSDDEGRQKIEFDLNKVPKGVPMPRNSMSIKNALAKFAAD